MSHRETSTPTRTAGLLASGLAALVLGTSLAPAQSPRPRLRSHDGSPHAVDTPVPIEGPPRRYVPAPLFVGSCIGDAGNLLFPLRSSDLADWTFALPACDDCSTNSLPLGFAFDLYGDSYTSVYVNNNGNLSFGAPLNSFFPSPFPDTRFATVAPFYADGDTRENPQAAVPADVYRRVLDGNGDGRPDTFVATWRNVGYYEKSYDRRNTFQVAISDGTNPAMGLGNNVCFSYDAMCWTTGRYDGGVGGFGATPAVVGVNRGDGVHAFRIGRFNQNGAAYEGPNADPGGVQYLDRRVFCFSTATTSGNICPIADVHGEGPIVLAPMQRLNRTLRFLSPEVGQTTTVLVDDPDRARHAGLAIATEAGNMATAGLDWTPSCEAIGEYRLVFRASDDAAAACTTDRPLEIVVTCDDGDPSTTDTCDPAVGCVRGEDKGTYFSTALSQFFAGFTAGDGDIVRIAPPGSRERPAKVASFSNVLGVDALDATGGGNLLFSLRSWGGIHHAGGFLETDAANILEYDRATGQVRTRINWRALGIDMADVDAVTDLGDGTIAFSTSILRGVSHAGGFTSLRPQNVYRFDPATRRISLLFDGRALGLPDLDGFDVCPDGRVAFSTASPGFLRGVSLWPQSAYVLDGDSRPAVVIDGLGLGLLSLDDFSLGTCRR